MKNNIFSLKVKLLAAALVLVCGVVLTGCKPEVQYKYRDNYYYILPIEADNALIGTWSASAYEKYIITKDTFESKGTYTCNSLVVMKESETAGIIFAKYSAIPDWTKGQTEEPSDTTGWTYTWGQWYPSNTELVGKWYAVSYTNLTADSIKIAGALGSKPGHSVKGTATLEEAIEEFTVENGYFGQYSDCSKE